MVYFQTDFLSVTWCLNVDTWSKANCQAKATCRVTISFFFVSLPFFFHSKSIEFQSKLFVFVLSCYCLDWRKKPKSFSCHSFPISFIHIGKFHFIEASFSMKNWLKGQSKSVGQQKISSLLFHSLLHNFTVSNRNVSISMNGIIYRQWFFSSGNCN